jgi:DNA-binding transcriptional LysR family regulator
VVRREAQGRLIVGVLPALDTILIQRATLNFLKRNPNIYCSVQSNASQRIVEGVLSRQIDVGIVSARIDNPALVTEPFLEHPLVCIMPLDHPLARLKLIRPKNLSGVPFVSFTTESYTGQKIASIFEQHSVNANVVLTATAGSTVCQFVAAGLGISIVHPLFIAGLEKRIVARPFEPVTPFDFLLCFARDARDAHLISDFAKETRALGMQLSQDLKRSWA